jgi:hypothetical protein
MVLESVYSRVLRRTLKVLSPSCVFETIVGVGLREVSMGSRPRAFDPLDLEIIDRVYEAAWAQVEARSPFRNPDSDGERREALRKYVISCAIEGKIEFDALYERVVAHWRRWS